MTELSPDAKRLFQSARRGLEPNADAVASLRSAVTIGVAQSAAQGGAAGHAGAGASGSAGGAGATGSAATAGGAAGGGTAGTATGAFVAAKIVGAGLLLGALGLGGGVIFPGAITGVRGAPPASGPRAAVAAPTTASPARVLSSDDWVPSAGGHPLVALPVDGPSTPAESLPRRTPAATLAARPVVRAPSGSMAGPRTAAANPFPPESALADLTTRPGTATVVTTPVAFAAVTPSPVTSSAVAITSGAATSPAAVSPAPDDHSLVQEIALVRDAQAALDRGDAASALTLLRDHARRYPSGALREEDLALQVLALCALGRPEAARVAARELTRVAPTSAHLAGIRSSCAGPQVVQ